MVEIKETDFPRDTQKKVQNKKRKAKNIDGDEPNPKKQLKGAKEGKGKKVETSWVHHISRELFVDGLMGVGIISEISKQFAKAYNDGKITLEDAFSVGQALQFRVLPKNKKDLPKVVKATCNPTKLNSHLTPSMLSTGLVLLSTVSSVQEKGAILDIGLDKIQGFVATEKLQSPKLTVGQPLMVRIESVQSRVVQVTAFVEQDNLCMGACEKLQLNHLTPGTIIDCEPTDDEPTATGVMVSIGNGLKGILPRKNLPPRLRESTANLGKSVRATVVFCQQNSNVLVLNAHPDIVALSKPERRTAFEGYNLGDKLKCTVFDLVLSSSTAYLHLPLKDGKKSLVTAVCQKSFMNKTEKVESDFEIGSEKECRVMGFRFMERSLVVATRSDILKQKFVSYNEAICGQVADAKVRHVSKGGVFLIVEHFIRGFMPITMISDKGASFVRTKFPIDSNVKVKLWDVDSSKKRVIVTTRESIMEAKGPAVKTTEDVVEGALYPAVIIQKFVTGALLMKTYHGVCGVMLGKHAQALESDANNVVVLVQVESIIDEKITFVPADSEKSKGKKGVQRPKRVDEHLEVSKSVHGEAKIEKQGAPVRVTVDANKVNVTLTIEDHFLSDRLETPTATIRGALTKPKNLTNLVPLGKVNGENRAIVSGYASYWLKRNSQPANFEELKEKQVVLVVVTQSVAESGTFAELVGGSGLFGRVELPEDVKDVIELGQLLLCSVKKIDDTKKQFVLELTQNSDSPKEVIDEFALPLLKSIVEDSFWITENSEFPAIGTTVNAKVKNDAAALTIAQFTHNGKKLSGVVVAKGKLTKKSTFVVADVNPESSEIVLAVQDSEKPHIVVNRKDYTCAVDKNGIIILPSRIHINQLKTEPESGDVEVLDAVEFKSVRIAYTANSLKLAEKFLSQELTTKKTRKEKEEKKSVSTSSTKVFGIYDAVVVDEQKADKHCKKPTLFAQLTMPGGSKGRLHVSELAAKRRNVTGDAIRSFISANKKKSLLVKVIGYTKIGSDRVADVTMREEKMEATKNRQKELNYKSNFKVGDKVECYSSTTDDDQKTRFEINGVWVGSAAKENLPDEYLVNRGGTSEIVDVGIPRGTRLTATILSINNKKNHVELTFKGAAKDTSKKAFVIGETLTGRIFSVSRKPINAMIKLESGHQAVLSPTALTSNYEKVVDIVKKTCEEGKMMKVVAVKLTSAPKRYFVASLERYEATEDVDRRPLLKEREDVKENEKYDGLIVKREKSAFHVEIGPGIVVKVKLGAENGQLKSLQINSVVTVKVTEVPEEGPINADLINVLTTVIDKKRSAADSEDAPASKQKKVEKEDGSKVVPVVDPGFDWNDTAFQSESLAAVGKLTTETVVSEKKPKQQKSAEDEDEEVTEEELQKQVRSEPNSALVWIKYLTLFLEKNDLTAARATAERALQTISYKEDAEMANMWTAYLNMEVAYGDAASVQKVFERACSNADSFSIHKKLAQIYENAKKMEEAKTIYEAMVKKFRADHHEVWTMFAEHHMANGNTKAARDLLPRALDSTHKKNHVQILQKFALIEFKNGDKERAKTIFESLCTEYKKKTDIWLVYADAAIKNVGIELARSILERAVAVGNSIHMLRPLYKKWLTIEEQHGDAESISLVKNKAEKYLQSVADSINKE